MQRERRRTWVFCLGAGICCALLPIACTPAPARADDPEALRPETAAAAAALPAGPAHPEPEPAADGSTTADRRLAEIEALLAGAYFETALSLADSTRGLLEADADPRAQAARRARLEVMAAEAQLALGRPGRARRSLERALSAEPGLELSEARSSPRLVALLTAARRRVTAPERRPANAGPQPASAEPRP